MVQGRRLERSEGRREVSRERERRNRERSEGRSEGNRERSEGIGSRQEGEREAKPRKVAEESDGGGRGKVGQRLKGPRRVGECAWSNHLQSRSNCGTGCYQLASVLGNTVSGRRRTTPRRLWDIRANYRH